MAVARKPFLAIFSITTGLLMITAGLGYTVTQASRYTEKVAAQLEDSIEQPGLLPDNDSAWQGDHPKITRDQKELKEIEMRRVLEGIDFGKPDEADFFFPALSLLSGAILASIGAIALIHRWKGISN